MLNRTGIRRRLLFTENGKLSPLAKPDKNTNAVGQAVDGKEVQDENDDVQ